MNDNDVAVAPRTDSTGLTVNDAVAQALELLRGAARREVSAAALQVAREEGFALGREVGRAEAMRELRVRLNQLLVDLAAKPAEGAILVGNATDIGFNLPVTVPEVARDACRPGQALWRTAAREAVVRRMAAEGRAVAEIHRTIQAIPGPEVPRDPSNTRHWMKAIGLWKPAVHAAPESKLGRDEAHATLPPVTPSETPQMLRARELLAMGIDLQVIKTAVKLSIEEFQSLANTHSAVTRAA